MVFTGHVAHDDLLACYAAAGVFVSMSEHEGFGVPLVESMLMRVPVLAYAATAVPFTLGGAGVQFGEKRHRRGGGDRRARSPPTRRCASAVLAGQDRRLAAFAPEAVEAALRAPRGVPVSDDRPEVAFVVQRYGEGITGGSESLARAVAERLAAELPDHASSRRCARDYVTWRNELPAGRERLGGVEVRRFPVEEERDLDAFNAFAEPLYRASGRTRRSSSSCAGRARTRPRSSRRCAAQKDRFAAVVFFTYLYYPTYWGLRAAPERVGARADHPRRAAAALLDLPGGLRARRARSAS